MHNDGKVVPISTAHAMPSPLARLPIVLQQVRDKAAQQLQQGLQELFDNADDTLFEMADKAGNNLDHHIFFEAMRDLRLKRKNFERVFMQRLFDAFAELGLAGRGVLQRVPALSYDTTPGTSKDEQEKAVALDAMLGRVHHRDGLALSQLTARLSAVLGNRLDDRENPLGPAQLCEFFLQAGRSLGVEIRVKLIMLKLFEKYVLSDADQLYCEANQLLVATGVLPELKAVPSRRPGGRAPVITSAKRQCRRPISPSMKMANRHSPPCRRCWPQYAVVSRPPWKPAPHPSPSPPATSCGCYRICSNTCRSLMPRTILTCATNSSSC